MPFYVTITGAKQGAFKGESTNAKHTQSIEGLGFSFDTQTPVDPTTGQASSKRQHSPITITKEWGAASPQLLQALTTNEVLTSVVFEFVFTSPTGVEQAFQTITLTNATVVEQRRYINYPPLAHGGQSDRQELEEISFVFQKIELTDTAGGTTATDDWLASS